MRTKLPNLDRNYSPTFDEGRLFLPLSISGCGIGCKYCYIPSPQKRVVPISKELLTKDINSILKSDKFKSGPLGTVISIGCDTDPFLNSQTSKLVIDILSIFKNLRNPIQLSTKCIIPNDILSLLNNWPDSNPKPIIFTSLSSISMANKIEPHAPSVLSRIRNLTFSNKHWITGVMIKPIIKATLKDKEEIYNLLSFFIPNIIIIGVRYSPIFKSGYPPHPLEKKWFGIPFSTAELKFSNFLKENLGIPIYHSSLCATANSIKSSHALNIFKNHSNVCANCGLCKNFM